MKNIKLAILLLLTISVSACKGINTGLEIENKQVDGSLSFASELVVGTLKLEETDQLITGEQAKELLTMWKVYDVLINSDTSAQQEMDDLLEQIQDTMTLEQNNAINAMDLGQQDVQTILLEQGVSMENGQTGNENGDDSSNSESFAPPDAGVMNGEMPTGIDGTGMIAAESFDMSASGGGDMDMQRVDVSPLLVNSLIDLLETKINL